MEPKIFAEKIYYYEGVIENPKELVELIELTDPNITCLLYTSDAADD